MLTVLLLVSAVWIAVLTFVVAMAHVASRSEEKHGVLLAAAAGAPRPARADPNAHDSTPREKAPLPA